MQQEGLQQVLYPRNCYVAVHDPTAKNGFVLGLVTQPVEAGAGAARIIFLVKDQSNSRHFNPLSESVINAHSILCSVTNIRLKRVRVEGAHRVVVSMGLDHQIQLEAKVKQILEERADEFEAGMSEESEEEQQLELDEPSQVLASFLPNVPAERRLPGAQLFGAAKPRQARAPRDPNFRKGKFNLLIDFIPSSLQFHALNTVPDFSCCSVCNSKELLRCVLTNNPLLLERLKASSWAISTGNCPMGPNGVVTPLTAAFSLNRLDLFYQLLSMESSFSGYSYNSSSLGVVDTGYNDKYAYGVATRKVNMSRNNREGNNAFTYDNSCPPKFIADPKALQFFYARLLSEEVMSRVWTINSQFRVDMTKNLLQIVFAGNRELVSAVVRHALKVGGWGLSLFHYLALVAREPEELQAAGMKRPNVRKKSMINMVSPLHLAATNPYSAVFDYFLSLAEDLYATDELFRKPVHYAAVNDSPDCLALLHARGIDIRDCDNLKTSPLHYAAAAGKPANIRKIFELTQCNLNLKTKAGYAPLHLAVLNSQSDAAEALIALGANVNISGPGGVTPLMIACQHANLPLCEILLGKGGRILGADKTKKTPLIYAVISGDLSLVSFLLRRGAEWDRPDSSGNTPLHFAAAYGFFEMVPLFLRAGSDVNARNSWNMPPISLAFLKGHYRIIDHMKELPNIDVNYRDEDGFTFLLRSVEKFDEKSLGFAEFLLKRKGADPNATNNAGQSCLDLLLAKEKSSSYNPIPSQNKAQKQKRTAFLKKFFDLLVESGARFDHRTSGKEVLAIRAFKQNKFLFFEWTSAAVVEEDLVGGLGLNIFFNLNQLLHSKHFLRFFRFFLSKLSSAQTLADKFDERGQNFFHHLLVQHFSTKFEYVARQKYNGKRSRIPARFRENNSYTDQEKQEMEDYLAGLPAREQQYLQIIENNFPAVCDELKRVGFDTGRRLSRRMREHEYTAPTPAIVHEIADETEQHRFLRLNRPPVVIIDETSNNSLFHSTVSFENPEVFNFLARLNGPFTPNDKNDLNQTTLHTFMSKNCSSSEMLTHLLVLGEDPNVPNSAGSFPLLQAVERQNIVFMDILLRRGADPNARDRAGNCSFIAVCKKRWLEGIKLLVEVGKCDVNIKDPEGRNGIHWSIITAQANDISFEQEEYLVRIGVRPDERDCLGRSPLFYFFAAPQSLSMTTKTDPVDNFADFIGVAAPALDLLDVFQRSLLSYAVQRGSYLCAITLIKNKADVEAIDLCGNSPLATAILSNQYDLATMLLHKGVNIERPAFLLNEGTAGRFFAELLASHQRERQFRIVDGKVYLAQSELQEFLSALQKAKSSQATYRPNLNVKELPLVSKETTLFSQCLKRKLESVSYLLMENGYDLGRAAMACISNSRFHQVIKLLKRRCDPDEERNNRRFHSLNKNGNNILLTYCNKSARNSDPALAQKLFDAILAKKFNLNHQNKRGTTAVMYLAQRGSDTYLANLLDLGADPNLKDEFGRPMILFYILQHQFTAGHLRVSQIGYLDGGVESITDAYMQIQLRALEQIVTKYRVDLNFTVHPHYFGQGKAITNLTLYAVITCHNLSLLRLLAKLGLDFNLDNLKQRTVLTHAIRNNDLYLFDVLMGFQSRLNFRKKDHKGKTYVHHCVEPIKFASFLNVRFLERIAPFADLDQPDNDGRSPAYYASKQGNRAMFEKLLALGAKRPPDDGVQLNIPQITQCDYPQERFDYEQDFKTYAEAIKNDIKEFVRAHTDKANRDTRVPGEVRLVLDEAGEAYSVQLAKVDIRQGEFSVNLFYKMQVYEDTKKGVFVLFTNWGRIGEAGQHQLTPFNNLPECLKEFRKIFREKSRNEYEARANFQKKDGYYNLVTTRKEVIKKTIQLQIVEKNTAVCTLPSRVASVVRAAFDVGIVRSLYQDCGFSWEDIPIEQNSVEQLDRGLTLLDEMEEVYDVLREEAREVPLQEKADLAVWLERLTSQFLETLPMVVTSTANIKSFGRDVVEQLMKKIRRVKKTEHFFKMLAASTVRSDSINPYDYLYSISDFKLCALADSHELRFLRRFVKSASSNRLTSVNILAVERKDERELFVRWNEAGERVLLFLVVPKRELARLLLEGARPSRHSLCHEQKTILLTDQLDNVGPRKQSRFYFGKGYGCENVAVIVEASLGKNLSAIDYPIDGTIPAEYDSFTLLGSQKRDENMRAYLYDNCRVELGAHWPRLQPDPDTPIIYKTQHNIYFLKHKSQVKLRYLFFY